MSSHAATTQVKANWGGGGVSPLGASYGKLYMWFFLVSDAFTFSGLLTAYGFMRHKYTDFWPNPGHVFHHFPFYDGSIPLAYVGLMTFILIFSSVTMVLAVHEGHKMNRKGVEKYMILTIIGGIAFLACQAWEWTHMITGDHKVLVNGEIERWGTTVTKNPWGPHVMHNVEMVSTPGPIAFGGYFFGITGFHGFHVFSGVIINVVMLIKTRLKHFDQRGHYEMIEKAGLYWHFVDLVWVFVFLCFYLV